MIRINKSTSIPTILLVEGVALKDDLINKYDANPSKYTSRLGISAKDIIKMEFDNDVYGSEKVKNQIIKDQHGKCCFCEAKFGDNSYGDVEHFRPKKAYKKKGERSLTYPGYYWLAYNWNNLLFSCEKCNRTYKKNNFPLGAEATRKLSYNHPNDLNNEDNLLINPINEDPSAFITFHGEVPVAIGGNLKGVTSIKTYGLERMNDSRLEYLNLLKGILPYAEIDINDNVKIQKIMDAFKFTKQEVLDLITQAIILFNNAAKDNAKFALCIRCKFPLLPTT